MGSPSTVTTFLFTDIEQSSRLWEQHPERMGPSLARHDALAKSSVETNNGQVVKMTGDGMYAVFDDPRDAILACVEFQQAIEAPMPDGGIQLLVRCGLHAGIVERRSGDFFGNAVNRAARIMSAAHGGQVLASQTVADLVTNRLPADVRLRDLGSVRLRDLATPERLFQVTHPRLRPEFPPLRSLESLPHNLPQPTTSFVGRERQLADARQFLARGRLVTLHGPGGIGKTRLSLQIASDALPDFPEGAWFVELAAIDDPRRVPQAVASTLGIKEESGRPLTEAVVRSLRDRRLLLVLDNSEHLIQACVELAVELLRGCPHVKILATSREPLNIAGETTYPVPALALPKPGDVPAADVVTRYEGLRLFVERATTVAPAFAVTMQNAPVVVEICRRLDGIPLAIELAAARVRAMSVEDIAARLSDRFRLLSRGERTALPRQQTLRALIDWSYDLLSELERTLLRRLAVFAGGWTLASAESIAAGGDVVQSEVLDLQSQLVYKSLVAMDAEGGRYRLLDTVRDYARERLDSSNDGPALRKRHLDHFVAFAESARTHLSGLEEAIWLARLDAERENLLTAHAWGDHSGAPDLGLRLASALKPYLFNRGMLGLAYRITAEALARIPEQDQSVERCRSLFDAGQICYFMGRYGDAGRYLEECLAVARALGDSQSIARALQPLGLSYVGQGNLAAARVHLEEALTLARSQGDKRQVAAALNALGQLRRVEGALDESEPMYAQALALAHEIGDRETTAVGLLNLAMVDVERGTTESARRRLVDVLRISDEIGSKPAGQSVVEVCAGMAALEGDWLRAARFFGAAEEQTSYTGISRDPADDAYLRPLIERARRTASDDAFASAEQAGRALTYEDVIAEARAWLTGQT